MASIKLLARKENTKKDGKVPVYLLLIHMGKPVFIPLNIYVNAGAFDFKALKCTPKHDHYLTYNAKLSEKKAIAETALIDLSDRIFTPESLAEHIKIKLRNDGQPTTIGNLSEQIQALNIKQGSPGNAEVYKNVITTFIKWNKDEDPFIKSVDYKMLLDYKTHLIKSKRKPNTISNYLRTIRSVFNYAIGVKAFPSDPELFPFKKGLVPSGTRGKKKVRDKKTLAELEKIAPTLTGFMQLVAHTTLLQFYFQGCDFIDIVLGMRSEIKDGYWTFYRYKNRQDADPPPVKVKIIPKANNILDLYDSKFIVPICDDFQVRTNLKLYKTRRRNFNRSLALVCSKLNLKKEEYLSCKDMRYYWATIAANMGVNEEDRMRCQGQKIPGVAEGYIDYDQSIIDNINKKVTK